MAPLRVGLMGFGRIGRNLFRILYGREDIQIAAISDVADHASLEYLLRFDTILGRFPGRGFSIKGGTTSTCSDGRSRCWTPGRSRAMFDWRRAGR